MLYGERLKELREEQDLSQFKISEILNLHKKVYGQYEREYVIIPLKHLNTLINYFNTSFDYVFNFTKKKNYDNYFKEIDKKKLGVRLKEMRQKNKITQKDLADYLKVAVSVIAGAEQGRRIIATPFLYAICKKYAVSADYLLGKID